MQDFAAALGLVLVIEGALWALFPRALVRWLAAAAAMPEARLQLTGAAVATVGLAVVWLVRG